MFATVVKKIFGSRNDRALKQLQKQVSAINAIESDFEALSDEQLRAKTDDFKRRFKSGESLENLIVDAFAAVREASKRTLGLRHFDVQLVGGMVLHHGRIAEMQTGEGKTLVATLAAYLNALSGQGVHVITVNDYLARRDAEWMQPIYEFLGLTVGAIVAGLEPEERKAAYRADITYGTNNEFGFDYLRDNMAFSTEDKVQRELNFAIVDEVDSILIDEARTPLIISGQVDESPELYRKVDNLIPNLIPQIEEEGEGDYHLDEKAKQVFLTEAGSEKIEQLLAESKLLEKDASLYDTANVSLLHYVTASLRARTLFKRDVDYIVRNDQIVIVDEHTGRMMPGRRWSEGLHQAVEAKENVTIQNETQTLASITFQNYFRLYDKLSGMTGTADTEAHEFLTIYGLEVMIIPPNRPNVRADASDLVFITTEDKFTAIVEAIKESSDAGRPILVGTASIEASELISKLLDKAHINHSVLNAKQHAKEADIIAQAGRPGAVTIATNMAGRGTDIVLGGNPETEIAKLESPTPEAVAKVRSDWQKRHAAVLKAGGLHIIGTERHESRRIDNQLRGRAGRQGDPGSSRFYLSLDDNLIRIFASERMTGWMQRLGFEEGEAIEHPWLTRAIENAQRKVEGRNFDIRKQLLDYDNVANDQRTVIYAQRAELMEEEDITETIEAFEEDVLDEIISTNIPPQSVEDLWETAELQERLQTELGLDAPVVQWLKDDETMDEMSLRQKILGCFSQHMEQKRAQVGDEIMLHFQKAVMLQSLDKHWRDHLAAMDHLRQSIHLRGYAQKQPMQEYKREAFELFTTMLERLKREVVMILARVQVRAEEDVEALEAKRRQANANIQFRHQAPEQVTEAGVGAENASDEPGMNKVAPFKRNDPKVGRNEPCPCGSGKKFKQCHGKLA